MTFANAILCHWSATDACRFVQVPLDDPRPSSPGAQDWWTKLLAYLKVQEPEQDPDPLEGFNLSDDQQASAASPAELKIAASLLGSDF